jgi:hypothetical protein
MRLKKNTERIEIQHSIFRRDSNSETQKIINSNNQLIPHFLGKLQLIHLFQKQLIQINQMGEYLRVQTAQLIKLQINHSQISNNS